VRPPKNIPFFVLELTAEPPHRSPSGLSQAPAPSVGSQVLFRVFADRRRLGYPRSLPEDLETSSYQGMACAQNYLSLYQDLHASMLHRGRLVPTPALPRLATDSLITSLLTAVQFFDTKWTQEVRILRRTHRFLTSDADARTLEL